jgi:methionine-rich copper-binding protein CopC
MDHAYIAEHDLVDRYYQGRLPPEEELSFEEHFVDCPECLQQLELARSFQRGFKNLVEEDLARLETTVRVGIFAWLARLSRSRQAGLALTAVLVAIALPILWFRTELLELRRDVDLAQSTLIDAEKRLVAEQRMISELEERLADDASAHVVERERLEAELAAARQSQATPSRQTAPSEPWINVPVFLLRKVRSNEPANHVELGRAAGQLSLAIDIGNDPDILSYRAVLTSTDGPRWRQDGLEPNALEVILITFPKDFLPPGDYRLELTGVRADGSAVELGGYAFKVGQ